MKICIIADKERAYLPFVDKYEETFKEFGASVDIITWNHTEKPLYPKPNEKIYYAPKRRLFKKEGFKQFVYSVLSKGQYDKVVVLTTAPALMFREYLKNKYDGRYLFDYRDYTKENNESYRMQVEDVIEHSALTSISSYGFLDYLQKRDNLIINHNISKFEENKTAADLKAKPIINIGYLGTVWEFDENTFFIEHFKDEFRYQLWYIGLTTPDCDLQGYCESHSINNVSFAGRFEPGEKVELYKTIDIVNSIYGADSFKVTASLPTRLYEACQFKKPIIASKGTYLGEIVAKFSLGLTVDAEKDDVLALVNDYVKHFNPQEFCANCDGYLALVREDEAKFKSHLAAFVKGDA